MVVLLISSCATTINIPESEKASLPRSQWSGTWFGNSTSYFGHDSSNGLKLNEDGTGYLVSSAIFQPQHNPSFWVRRIDFKWTFNDPSSIKVNVTGKRTLAGSGTESLFGHSGSFSIFATKTGLRVSNFGKQKSPFIKYPGGFSGDMAGKVIEETRRKALALGGYGNPNSGLSLAQVALGALSSYQKGLNAGNSFNANGIPGTYAQYSAPKSNAPPDQKHYRTSQTRVIRNQRIH